MNRTNAITRGAGRMTLATSPRIRDIAETAHRRNRTRTQRSFQKVGDSIRVEITRRSQG
ncbi:hypothetical protein [Corynebacterium sphenisci]|uniref:hypothetical protein n=1 Tax=Corynebacterium sphenisci TaxID=191493 RepID=UPI0012F481BD|nr:hypothetical protein [Corynebacterium sphenisci]